jgi:hypothetical protein
LVSLGFLLNSSLRARARTPSAGIVLYNYTNLICLMPWDFPPEKSGKSKNILCTLTFNMLSIPILIVIITLLLAWFGKSAAIWKFTWINLLVMLIYNLSGWLYICNFMNEGGASLGPGLLLMLISALHICILFITIVVMTIRKSAKDQHPNYGVGRDNETK